jgi:hypothetical protein
MSQAMGWVARMLMTITSETMTMGKARRRNVRGRIGRRAKTMMKVSK